MTWGNSLREVGSEPGSYLRRSIPGLENSQYNDSKARACLSSMSNKASIPQVSEGLTENCTGGNIWNYLCLWQYFQFHFVFSKDCIISQKKTRQIFAVVAECNPPPPPPPHTQHNAFGFFCARLNYFRGFKCTSLLCLVHTWLWVTLFAGCFIPCGSR